MFMYVSAVGRKRGDGFYLVDERSVAVPGDEARPDALDLVRPRLAPRQHRRLHGLNRAQLSPTHI